MQRKTKQALALIAIVALFMQTLFGSLPAMATGNLSPLHITMTTNGQPYNEGDTATSAVEVQVATTSGDSAGIEISQDARTTWQPFDDTQPLVITEEGEHELWFRLADVEEKRIIKIDSLLVQPLQLMKTTTANSVIIYVDAKSNGGNGESWTTAYNDLQQALNDAKAKLQVAPTTKLEIWLAAGTYKPTKKIDSSDPRTATFQMQNNVAIYGGFNGMETELTERDWENNETILSGDIDNIPTDNSGNSYHVFYHPDGLQLNSTAILDGVTITGGNASGANQIYSNSGGGMYNYISSPTLTHVTFRSNEASYGGGMSNKYSSPTLTHVTFSSNKASYGDGGGMSNNSSNPTLTNVIFEHNTATTNGGGMSNDSSSSATLTHVTFRSNEALYGGGMYNNSSSPTLTNVIFEHNTATTNGGGMYNDSSSSPTLTNVIFEHNTATNFGGGMYNYISSPTLTHVTFRSNEAFYGGGGMYNNGSSNLTLTNVIFEHNTATHVGGGMYNYNNSSPTLINVTMSGNKTEITDKGAIYGGSPKIYNSLIAGNNGEPALHSSVSATIENSLLDVAESGHILAKFHQSTTDIQPDTYTPEAIFIDPNHVNPSQRNYQLRAGSPAINKGNNTLNATATDLAGNLRIQGGIIDLGAYEAFPYHITYERNDATSGNAPIDKLTYQQGDTVTIQNNSGILERTGHTFVGWNTQADGTGDDYAENTSFTMGEQNQTFYAKWIPNNYKVIFESNGGSDVAEQQVLYNEKAIAPPVPSKQGHTFAGWYTDGNEEWDFAMDVVTKDITLYAQWTVNPTYTMTYDANGATGGDIPEDTQKYEENASVTVQGNSGNLTRTGYTFAGWNTQADGQGDSYAENDTFIMGTSHQILYAKWTENPTYMVTYDPNGATGGDVPHDNQRYEANESVKVKENSGQLVKTGSTFVGWNTQAGGKGDSYAENDTFIMGTSHQILYAQWTENPTYTVTYDPNGATGGEVPKDTQRYEEKASVTVQGNSGNLERTGYIFADWNTQADGKGDSYAENGTFIIGTSNQILYAKWIPNTYTVTFKSNGGSDVAEQQVLYNEKAIAPPVPRKQGHTFFGWYKDSRFTMKWDFTADVVTEAITLYAKWQVNSNPPPADGGSNTTPISNDNPPPAKVKITLHTNGGTAIAPIDIAYNTKISDLPIPTREGYRFDGWYQDEELTKPWAADTVLRENISLYAKWTALPVEESEPLQEPQPQPEPPKLTVTFSDIERHWAKEMIEELATQGIIQGYEDGAFRPNESISRMHVAALIGRAFTFEPKREAEKFSDVSPTHLYYEAIMTLQQAGIVDGTNGAFLPAEKMTRAQLAKVLVGLMNRTPEGISSFADVDQKHWSAGYIAVLEQEGIALGDNGKFNPNAPVTRAQFITFLYRVMQTIDS